MRSAIGIRKKMVPKTSIHACARGESRPAITSMRTCSLRSSVNPEHRRKTAEKRYHCASRNAFELMLKSLRTIAFPALTSTATSTSQ